MRFRTTPLRISVAGAAAALLLAACGGGGGGNSAAGTTPAHSPSSSSAPATTASSPTAADAGGFCDQVTTVFGQLQSAFSSAQPAQIPALLQQVITAWDSITPPPEIANDWHSLSQALHQLADQIKSIDLSTPEGQQQYEQAAQQLTASVQQAQQNLTGYILSQCLPSDTASAAPSS